MKSVKLRFIRCNAHLTACSGRHRLTFFCKALFTTEMEIFLLHLYIGKNVFDDSMLVARSNNPFFVFSKLGSLKLSLDAWNLISFWLCKFLYTSLFLSSHVQRELSKEQMLEEVPLVTHRQNASLLGFFFGIFHECTERVLALVSGHKRTHALAGRRPASIFTAIICFQKSLICRRVT